MMNLSEFVLQILLNWWLQLLLVCCFWMKYIIFLTVWQNWTFQFIFQMAILIGPTKFLWRWSRMSPTLTRPHRLWSCCALRNLQSRLSHSTVCGITNSEVRTAPGGLKRDSVVWQSYFRLYWDAIKRTPCGQLLPSYYRRYCSRKLHPIRQWCLLWNPFYDCSFGQEVECKPCLRCFFFPWVL